MDIFIHKKLKTFSFLLVFLFSNPILAEQLLTKPEILNKSNECFKYLGYEVCSKLFLEIERMQLVESEKNRYKCQASLLGLQTEVIEAYHFKKSNRNQTWIMIPYVVKNC